jgi:hypothetical protein
MRLKMLAELLAFSAAVSCGAATPGFADAGRCRHVGGGILTNFLQKADCGSSPLFLCTDGPATGDFRGAVGVAVLAMTGNVLHNHHHWVTDSGDTIYFKDADLTLFSTSISGLFAGDYLSGIYITGGTGGFEGATGKIAAFGAVDENKGQLTLRYEGTVCLEPVPPP